MRKGGEINGTLAAEIYLILPNLPFRADVEIDAVFLFKIFKFCSQHRHASSCSAHAPKAYSTFSDASNFLSIHRDSEHGMDKPSQFPKMFTFPHLLPVLLTFVAVTDRRCINLNS